MNYAAPTPSYLPSPEIDRVGDRAESAADEDIETLIADTIRMIENTNNFIHSLGVSDDPMREYMRDASLRLERSLEALRRRRDELRYRECATGF